MLEQDSTLVMTKTKRRSFNLTGKFASGAVPPSIAFVLRRRRDNERQWDKSLGTKILKTSRSPNIPSLRRLVAPASGEITKRKRHFAIAPGTITKTRSAANQSSTLVLLRLIRDRRVVFGTRVSFSDTAA